MTANRVVRSYYLATPLFLILEIVFGFDLRLSPFIGDTAWRIAYYLFCFICMGIILWKPAFTIGVGIVESSVNLIFLFVGAALRWMVPFTWVTEGGVDELRLANPVTVTDVLNFALVGTILIICFQRWVALARRSGGSAWLRILTREDLDG